MHPTSTFDLQLPVLGMTCAGCAAQVEKALQKLTGVSTAEVDLAGNRVRVVYDSDLIDLLEVQQAVTGAGYRIPSGGIILTVQGMHCVSCAGHVEGALTGLPGVLAAEVSLSKATAQVTYVPGVVSIPEMEQAVRRAGYQSGGSAAPETGALPAEGSPGPVWRIKKLLRRK